MGEEMAQNIREDGMVEKVEGMEGVMWEQELLKALKIGKSQLRTFRREELEKGVDWWMECKTGKRMAVRYSEVGVEKVLGAYKKGVRSSSLGKGEYRTKKGTRTKVFVEVGGVEHHLPKTSPVVELGDWDFGGGGKKDTTGEEGAKVELFIGVEGEADSSAEYVAEETIDVRVRPIALRVGKLCPNERLVIVVEDREYGDGEELVSGRMVLPPRMRGYLRKVGRRVWGVKEEEGLYTWGPGPEGV